MGSMNAVLIWLDKSKGERVSAFKTLSFESKLTDPDAGDTPAIFFTASVLYLQIQRLFDKGRSNF
jgi:hypothetical protein